MKTTYLNELINEVGRRWKEIKQLLSDIANIPKENKRTIYHQTKWSLVRDTRLKSQVTNNKPKHLIKKIIR